MAASMVSQAGRAITRRARRPFRPGRWRAATVLGLVMTATVSMAGCRPPACLQPYPAAAWRELNTDPAPWPEGSVRRPQRTWVFDSDGDGVEDTVDGATDVVVPAITVHRAGGDLVFTAPDGVVAPREQPASDLDGDGRSEIEISTADPAGQAGPTYLIAGSTPDGSYDPADVGVLMPGRLPLEMRAGDVDGDGAQDLVGGDYDSIILSGRDVMAPGPGGTFDGPVRDLPFDLIRRPVMLSSELDALVLFDGGRAEIVLWVNGTSIRLTADNTPVPVHGEVVRMFAMLADGPDGQLWLRVQLAAPHPMVAEADWAWNLRSLCAGPSSPQLPV